MRNGAKPLVIVVYEDDELRWAITHVLRYEDYEVIAFDSAQAFLDSKQPARPACVVFGLPSKDLRDKDPQDLVLQLSAGCALVVVGSAPSWAESLLEKSCGRYQVLGPPLNEERLLMAMRTACRSLH